MSIDLFREAAEAFARGENVVMHFKSCDLTREQQLSVIEFAYDLQSGSYTACLKGDAAITKQKAAWGKEIAEIVASYGVKSLIEAGVGEGSTLKYIVDNLPSDIECAGFDLSVSRLVYAREVLKSCSRPFRLFTGNLASIPLIDNAYDAILTNHSIESNGGREREILADMLRATRRLLVLVEPDYAIGSAEQRARMEKLNYIRDLPGHIEALGANILVYKPWELNANPANAASLIVAEKPTADNWNTTSTDALASPFSKGKLEQRNGYLYSNADNVAFPIIDGFPCLLPNNAIVASHLNVAIKKTFA